MTPYLAGISIRWPFIPRDTPLPTVDQHTPHQIPFPAKPFSHLGIWAYLAVAIIIAIITTVLSYMVYSCYHSASRTTTESGRGRSLRNRGIHLPRVVMRGASKGPILQGPGFHKIMNSENQRRMMKDSPSYPSQSSMSTCASIEGDSTLNSNALVHTPGRAVSFVSTPCEIPPTTLPPAAHFSRNKKKKDLPPLPLFVTSKSPIAGEDPTQYDSNNIRYVSPRNDYPNPFVETRWNDPKLSPVGGSILIERATLNEKGTAELSNESVGKSPGRRKVTLLSKKRSPKDKVPKPNMVISNPILIEINGERVTF